MKRAIAVLLVAAMAFGMTACGSKNSGNNGGSTEAGKGDGTVYAGSPSAGRTPLRRA